MLITNFLLVIIALSLLGIFGIEINKERYTVKKDTVNSIKADKLEDILNDIKDASIKQILIHEDVVKAVHKCNANLRKWNDENE